MLPFADDFPGTPGPFPETFSSDFQLKTRLLGEK